MKKKVVPWWVPHMLFSSQRQCLMKYQEHLTYDEKEGIAFLQRIITINET